MARRASVATLLVITSFAIIGWILPTPGDGSGSGEQLSAAMSVSQARGAVRLLLAVPDSVSETSTEPVYQTARAGVIEAIGAVAEAPGQEQWAQVDALLVRMFEHLQELAEGESNARDDLATLNRSLGSEIDRVMQTESNVPGQSRLFRLAGALVAVLLGVAGLFQLLKRPARLPEPVVEKSGRPVTDALVESVSDAQSESDPVTRSYPPNVLDSDAFAAMVELETRRAARYRRSISTVTVVVENAEQILAAGGHEDLEYVVASIGDLAASNTRASDHVGLTGTDRLTILLPETVESEAQVVAQKLTRNVAVFPFAGDLGATVVCTCALIDPPARDR